MGLGEKAIKTTVMRLLGCLLLILGSTALPAQPGNPRTQFPLSSWSNIDCPPCKDTVRVAFIKKVYDISLLLPEWKPVVDHDHVAVLEGIVKPHAPDYISCHVSQMDFSAYHYTHDFGFDVEPIPTDDHRNTRYLGQRCYTGQEEDYHGPVDTVLQKTMHVEWESGLAASNKGNPCAEANRRGESCGFFSAGHQRRDIIWNWPTIGDWVHLEGQWIWDRGHPPARTEIHPIRFCAIRRNLPEYIATTEGGTDSVYATRLDIFGSGDGGALFNNRPQQPDFVHAVKMGDKDYAFTVESVLPKPGRKPRLRWREVIRPGDNYTGAVDYGDRDEGKLAVDIPWKSAPHDQVFARTIYFWWERDDGRPADYAISTYRITFEGLRIRQRKEFSSRSEYRIFMEAGGRWLFLNEFTDKDDVLKSGYGRTFKKRFKFEHSIIVHVPADKQFRVHVGGWEADGIDRVFGNLIDQNSPCTRVTKKKLHKHLYPATPFALHGCLDDLMGEVHDFHRPADIGDFAEFESSSQGPDKKWDQCPGVRPNQDDVFRIKYRIEKIQ